MVFAGGASAKSNQAEVSLETYTVWIGAMEKIASLHYVENFKDCSFSCHDHFMSFLCSLQDRGYRFQ